MSPGNLETIPADLLRHPDIAHDADIKSLHCLYNQLVLTTCVSIEVASSLLQTRVISKNNYTCSSDKTINYLHGLPN